MAGPDPTVFCSPVRSNLGSILDSSRIDWDFGESRTPVGGRDSESKKTPDRSRILQGFSDPDFIGLRLFRAHAPRDAPRPLAGEGIFLYSKIFLYSGRKIPSRAVALRAARWRPSAVLPVPTEYGRQATGKTPRLFYGSPPADVPDLS